MTDINELSPSFRLFSIPSFWDGVAMALDYSHTMPEFNFDETPGASDAEAVAADWIAVGKDLSESIQAKR